MKMPPKLALRLACLAVLLCLAAAAAAFPLVFTDELVGAFLRILELVARLS